MNWARAGIVVAAMWMLVVAAHLIHPVWSATIVMAIGAIASLAIVFARASAPEVAYGAAVVAVVAVVAAPLSVFVLTPALLVAGVVGALRHAR